MESGDPFTEVLASTFMAFLSTSDTPPDPLAEAKTTLGSDVKATCFTAASPGMLPSTLRAWVSTISIELLLVWATYRRLRRPSNVSRSNRGLVVSAGSWTLPRSLRGRVIAFPFVQAATRQANTVRAVKPSALGMVDMIVEPPGGTG